jgi:hypothetical protein
LKSEIYAKVKSDKYKIITDLVTHVYAMENKMGSRMSIIREDLETHKSDVRWPSTTRKALDKQHKMSPPELNNKPGTCGRISSQHGENSRPNGQQWKLEPDVQVVAVKGQTPLL